MTSEVHAIGAVALGYGIVYAGKQIGIELQPLYFIGGAWIGGLLPDIDHPKSKFGRKIQPVSTIIYAMCGHRTFTHSLLFVAIIGLTISMLNISLGTGLMVGMLSHILLDLVTPDTNGVAFLYPFYKDRIKLSDAAKNNPTGNHTRQRTTAITNMTALNREKKRKNKV